MNPEDVQKMIEAGLPDCEVKVTGDGSHFEAIVIGEVFDGLSQVKKQQKVYATLGDKITSGEVHALTIKTFTAAEYEKAQKLQVR
ncbi:MAG: BolA family transcriptional regulator [Gammaproteobacteria bacterium]|nr:BolA family transcriptional regulator [Gammaproteobacteria bacterium]MDH5659911.1 BolA family transcriptional regulator [Gammaproteobacteria bacterium]